MVISFTLPSWRAKCNLCGAHGDDAREAHLAADLAATCAWYVEWSPIKNDWDTLCPSCREKVRGYPLFREGGDNVEPTSR